MDFNMDLDIETFKKFQQFLKMKETMNKYKIMEEQLNSRKRSVKKYSQTEKGKQRRREASRRYYAKKRAEKLKSMANINAVSN
jgi:hypothetical protein